MRVKASTVSRVFTGRSSKLKNFGPTLPRAGKKFAATRVGAIAEGNRNFRNNMEAKGVKAPTPAPVRGSKRDRQVRNTSPR